MDEDEIVANGDARRGGGSFVGGLLLGAAIGAGLALLFAPADGRETRRKLARGVEKLREESRGRLAAARRRGRRLLDETREELEDEFSDR